MILVSACLLNYPVRYKGDSNPIPLLLKHAACGQFLPFCPECAGGLSTPRPPAEIRGGTGCQVWQKTARVINTNGNDVTASFQKGAELCAKLLTKHRITAAILKQRSPSCGTKMIYDGSFSSTLIPGAGVTAALLQSCGLKLYSEEDLSEELLLQLLTQDKRTANV